MTSAPPLGVQLWTVRDELVADPIGTLKQIASIGYLGVEAVLLPGLDAPHLRKLCEEAGLQLIAAHLPLPVHEQATTSIEDALALGMDLLVVTPGRERWQDIDTLSAYATEINEAVARVRSFGLRLGYHNHDWEFAKLGDGRVAYDAFLDMVDRDLVLEIDLYWAAVAGEHLPGLMSRLGTRVELLHVKDGLVDPAEPMVAVGDGVVDVPAALTAAASAHWHIVELDSCAGPILTALERSYDFLTRNDLSKGAQRD
jgi:sugar phosphate isomerase/epimerase